MATQAEFDQFLCKCQHPLELGKVMWPTTCFYDKQREEINSVRDSLETYVVAANKMGKDFVAGFICTTFFLRPMLYFDKDYVMQVEATRHPLFNPHPHTCRIITTSVAEHHLKVLWGEIGRFVTTSALPLLEHKGGPWIMNYQEVRWAWEKEAKNPLSYLAGRVSAKGEGLAGHHAAYTLVVGDEASGLDDQVHEMAQGWAKRYLYFGNANPTNNFWRKGLKQGDLIAQ